MLRKRFLEGVLIGSLVINPLSASAQTQSSSREIQNYYERGIECMNLLSWECAAGEFDKVLESYPDHTGAKQGAAIAHYNVALKYFRGDNWDRSTLELQRTLEIDPGYENARGLLSEIPMKIEMAERQREYEKKQEEMRRIEAERRRIEEARQAEEKRIAAEKTADAYLKNGSVYESRGLPGRALLEYLKADEILSGYNDVKSRIAKLNNQIKERAKNKKQDVVISITDETGSGIAKDIILSRVFKEMPEYVSLSDTYGSSTNNKAILVTINVSSLDIDQNQYSEPDHVRYRTGTSLEPNPAYEEALMAYERALMDAGIDIEIIERRQEMSDYKGYENQRRLEYLKERRRQLEEMERRGLPGILDTTEQMQNLTEQGNIYGQNIARGFADIGNAWARFGTVNDIENARRKLDETPMYIEVPNEDYWNYQTTTVIKMCEAGVAYKIISPSSEVMDIDTITRNAEVRDSTIDNPNPSIGIYADPLTLPSDSELSRRVLREVAGELSESIRTGIRSFCRSSVERQGSTPEGFENFVDMLYLDSDLAEGTGFADRYELDLLLKELRGGRF